MHQRRRQTVFPGRARPTRASRWHGARPGSGHSHGVRGETTSSKIQRQGIITRQLAAWAAILGVPAAIAAVYGMISPPDLAGLQPSHRIALVVTAMMASCVVLYVRFRKLHWL